MVFGEVDVIDVEIISGKIVGKSVKVVVFGKFDVVEVVVVLVFGKVFDVVEIVVLVFGNVLVFGKIFDIVEVVVFVFGVEVFGKVYDVVEVVVLVFGKVYDVVEVVSDVIEIVGKVGKIVVNKLLFVEIVGKSLLWLVEVVNKLLFFGKLFDVIEVVVLISGKIVKISFVEVVVNVVSGGENKSLLSSSPPLFSFFFGSELIHYTFHF